MIYITGDTHGDARRLSRQKLKNLKAGDILIICGDFGFIWDGSPKEQKILKNLGNRPYHICFIDGTHENFDLLNTFEDEEWKHGHTKKICGNLHYLKRGEIYHMDGLKIFTMGGGESPDREMRIGTEHWSKNELPSKEDLQNGIFKLGREHNEVDIILTHEPPLKTKEFLKLNGGEVRLSAINSYLDEISRICKYKKWYFGSVHTDKQVTPACTAVFTDIRNVQKDIRQIRVSPPRKKQ